MNYFDFSGTIVNPNNLIKNNGKYISLALRQNDKNLAYLSLFGDKNITYAPINVVMLDGSRRDISYSDRFNPEALKNIRNFCKYTIETKKYGKQEFLLKGDFIERLEEIIEENSQDIYEITGRYRLNYNNGKAYNNFEIQHIKIDNSIRPEFKMVLDLFYNNSSLDDSDKANKFILNAYIEQYSYQDRCNKFFPIKVQFVTNRFDFKKDTDLEILRYRRQNLNPPKNLGYVKARWEAQYVRGAQLILPPLETLPKAAQFEIKNAGRDIKEYCQNIVGTADEYICLTRPNNILNKDNEVFLPLDITDGDFQERIINFKSNSIDNIAKQDAIENPFN